MGRGGPDIGAALLGEEVAAWQKLSVANPKGEPSAEEREALKKAKAVEKKGKDALLEALISRLAAANAGSAALTICPNETAPAERAKTDDEWAPAAQKPTGIIFLMSSRVTVGVARASGASHMKMA